MIYESILDSIGNTPLIFLKRLSKFYQNDIYIKYEATNPFGSIKDRIAKAIIEDGIKKNLINKDTVIIEATSGNTGIGLAGVCLYYKLKLIIIMPDSATKERIDLLKAYHANVILTKKENGMKGALKKLDELKKIYPSYFIPSQFKNEINYLTHYLTTAREIDNTLSNIDYIVSGAGTGGTITGIGMYYKENEKKTKIIAVEPRVNSNLSLDQNIIDGIGTDFIPDTFKSEYTDEVISITQKEAYTAVFELLNEEALLLGLSTGASFACIKKLINELNLKNQTFVFISADNGIKYLSKYCDHFE